MVSTAGLFDDFPISTPVRGYILTPQLRDVAAGIAILLEAGGLVTTANPPEDPDTAAVEDVRLGSRLYLAIR